MEARTFSFVRKCYFLNYISKIIFGTFAATNFSRKIGENMNSLSVKIFDRARALENLFFRRKGLSVTRAIIKLFPKEESRRLYNLRVRQFLRMSKLFK